MATRKVAPAKKAPRAPASRPKAAKAASATNQAQVESDSTLPVGLNPRQRAFVVEYLKDKNATQAYMRVYGGTAKVAEGSGSRLLGNAKVKAEVDRIEAQQLHAAVQESGLTTERLTREVARGAFYDVRKLLDADGNPIPIHLLDDDTASAIAGLEIATERSKDPESATVTVVRKYKLADRKGFVDMGLKVKGLYKADNEQAGDAAAKALAGLAVRFVEPGAA
jgi:phage terminase small subunit